MTALPEQARALPDFAAMANAFCDRMAINSLGPSARYRIEDAMREAFTAAIDLAHAEAAALREALIEHGVVLFQPSFGANYYRCKVCGDSHSLDKRQVKHAATCALSTDAGRAMLERVRKAEATVAELDAERIVHLADLNDYDEVLARLGVESDPMTTPIMAIDALYGRAEAAEARLATAEADARRVTELETALREAHNMFNAYAEIHRNKGDIQKMERNKDMAAMCQLALIAKEPQPTTYICGCIASGDLVSTYCPIHGDGAEDVLACQIASNILAYVTATRRPMLARVAGMIKRYKEPTDGQ